MIDYLTSEELEIVDCYLNSDKSIREIAKMYTGYGRTKISNILARYASMSPENAERVSTKKISKKIHKEINPNNGIAASTISSDDAEIAYKEIIEGKKTLTLVAKELNKNRETVKKAIISFLGDRKEDIAEFNSVLRANQAVTSGEKAFETCSSENEKKEIIFSKLNYRRKLSGKNEYPKEMLERKYQRLVEYFEKRNGKINDSSAEISKEELLKMMFDHPTILSMSLADKINPIVKKLDYSYLGFKDTSKVLRENPAILGTSIQRTRLQVKILKETGTLDYALEKPRVFRTSPELMYLLIKSWDENGRVGKPFITRNRLYEQYGKTAQELETKFDIRQEYGSDEYFDGR